MKFTIGIALFTGLFVNKSLAGGIDVNSSGCQVQKVTQQDTFTCPCVGGSGDYDWHFSQLPQGWSSNKGQIVAPKGKFEDKKVYGAKVEVLDKKTKQSVKKSLFFSFENGKVKNIIDYKFDFDVKELIQDNRKPQLISLPVIAPDTNGANNNDINKVKRLFDDADDIGGGCGLAKVKPYFLGKGGLYKGDSANPYLNQLPTDSQVDAVFATGTAADVRVLIVNVVRSKVECKDVNAWLNAILQKLRARIATSKADVEETEKLILTVQAQISAVKVQISSYQANYVDINKLTFQVSALQATLAQAQKNQGSFQGLLAQAALNIDDYQNQISTVVDRKKKYQEADDAKVAEITVVDGQIAKLQAQIVALRSRKDSLVADREVISKQIAQAQIQIEALNLRIKAAKLSVDELNIKIKQAKVVISVTQTKIDKLQEAIHATQTSQKSIETLQAQLLKYQADLQAAQAKLVKVKAVFKDVNGNYEQLAKLGVNKFNVCYKTLFNDVDTKVDQDANGHLQFENKGSFLRYLNKVFNSYGNIKNIQVVITDNKDNKADTKTDVKQTTTTTGSTTTTTTTTTTTGSAVDSKVTVKQCNVFSREWTKTYGNPLDKVASNSIYGRDFDKDDFACQAPNFLNSYKGKIKSIQNHFAEVIDEKGVACTLYFGGCSRIQAVNKPLPQAGDDIYWLGTKKAQGRDNEYNAHHCTCV